MTGLEAVGLVLVAVVAGRIGLLLGDDLAEALPAMLEEVRREQQRQATLAELKRSRRR